MIDSYRFIPGLIRLPFMLFTIMIQQYITRQSMRSQWFHVFPEAGEWKEYSINNRGNLKKIASFLASPGRQEWHASLLPYLRKNIYDYQQQIEGPQKIAVCRISVLSVCMQHDISFCRVLETTVAWTVGFGLPLRLYQPKYKRYDKAAPMAKSRLQPGAKPSMNNHEHLLPAVILAALRDHKCENPPQTNLVFQLHGKLT